MAASQSVVKLASGDSVQIRAGLLTGVGPQGPLGPEGPQGNPGIQGVPGQPGQTNLFASFLSGPVSKTLSVPNSGAYTAVPLPTAARNDLLSTPLSQSAFSFASFGVYLVIARAHFDALASVTMNHSRALQLVDSTGTVYETVRESPVATTDPTDVVLVKFITDPGTGTLYHFQVAQDDTNGAVNLSDLEVQIVLCGSGPAGIGIHELSSGVVTATTPLSGFAEGVTHAVIASDSSMPAPNGMLQTYSIQGTGTQTFTSPPAATGAVPLVWQRTWIASASAWSSWAALNSGAQGLATYTPQLYTGSTVATATTVVGRYTRIGKLVYFNASVTVNGSAGITAGSGWSVTLPSAASATMGELLGSLLLDSWKGGSPQFGFHRILAGSNQAQLVYEASNNVGLLGVSSATNGGYQVGCSVYVAGWYFED